MPHVTQRPAFEVTTVPPEQSPHEFNKYKGIIYIVVFIIIYRVIYRIICCKIEIETLVAVHPRGQFTPMSQCKHCGRKFTHKTYLVRHELACELMHNKSNDDRRQELEEHADTPTLRKLY